MTTDQAFYLSVALINLILSIAIFRTKNPEGKPNSLLFLAGSYFAYFFSWLLYAFDLTTITELASAVLASSYIWSLLLFSYRRCEVPIPTKKIIVIFIAHTSIQLYYTYSHNITYVLHSSSLFVSPMLCLISYHFYKLKPHRNRSDLFLSYTFLTMATVIVMRSITLETSEQLYQITNVTSQVIWPAFCVAIAMLALGSFSEELQEKLIHDSRIDPLTGVFNRRGFMEGLQEKLHQSGNLANQQALILIDIDHFKRINDKYGHDAGDLVIRLLCKQIQQQLSSDDLFARYGGEEFILLLNNTNATAAEKLAERMRSSVQSLACQYQSDDITITASFGLVNISPSLKFDDCFKAADKALYKAKEGGRNQVQTFIPTPSADTA